MKPEQFFNRIGDIDDELIVQAENMPNFKHRRRSQGIRRIASLAAVFVLMVCSFGVGAFAFSKEGETVYVEMNQEIIENGDLGISLILPDEWTGKYGYDLTDSGIGVYQLSTYELSDKFGYEGYLFWIDCIEGVYPMDYVYPQPGYTIATTATHTYRIAMASDVQYDPNNETLAAEYQDMAQGIGDIKIVLSNWLYENSTNDTNLEEGTVYISYLEGDMISETVVCDEETSSIISNIVESQDYSLEGNDYVSDLLIRVNGVEYYLHSPTGYIMKSEGAISAVLSSENLQAILEQLNNQDGE